MPLTRQQKEERIAALEKNLQGATSAVFLAYDQLTVREVEELRNNLHASESKLQVIPKRLLKRVMKSLSWDFDPSAELGQMAVVWGKDPLAPAKTLHNFAKTRDTIRLVAGSLEQAVLSGEQVMALAKLPSRDQLLGQLLSVLIGPVRNFVSVLNGPQRQLVYALQAIADSKK
jgi:large subunit ribosomal protein L10